MPSGFKEFASAISQQETIRQKTDTRKNVNFRDEIVHYCDALWGNLKNVVNHFVTPLRVIEISFARIVSKFSFIPPRDTYMFKFKNEKKQNGELILTKLIAQNKHDRLVHYNRIKHNFECFYTITKYGNRIACVYIAYDNPQTPQINFKTKTIVYSHTNAEDIGSSITYLWRLRRKLKCNIFSYDYSGYGLSSGCPSERNIYADIEAALEELVSKKNVQPKDDIVLIGESIGTVPTIYMASKQTYAGVIIQSAFTSGLRIYFPYDGITLRYDPFPNIERIGKIQSKTLVVHGTADLLVNISHGIAIYQELANSVTPLWVQGAGHMTLHNYPQYFERLQHFVAKELVN